LVFLNAWPSDDMTNLQSPTEILSRACELIAEGGTAAASEAITDSYPFVPS
jgi:hypothetical protein